MSGAGSQRPCQTSTGPPGLAHSVASTGYSAGWQAARGLILYLTATTIARARWSNRLIDHLPSGEIVFNSYTRFAIWIAQRSRGTQSVADQVKFLGMDDARAPESWNPKLRLVREILLSREPEVAEFPPGLRQVHRLAAHSNALSRTGTIVLHYRF